MASIGKIDPIQVPADQVADSDPLRVRIRNEQRMGAWLYFVAALVFAMVLLGGATRLTQSGLSMVDWKPISGIMPPITAADWQVEFDAYKQFPEYQKINKGMSLGEFKQIFWFEYSHRVLGRIIGLAYFLPFLWFLLRGHIGWRRVPVFGGLFILGGLQGVIGWWMVKSGLADKPDVSHYRLMTHLGLAVFILGALIWVGAGLRQAGRRPPLRQAGRLGAWFVLSLIFLQILSGALVAGLDGGLVYNSFPKMDAHWIAPEVYHSGQILRDALEDPVTAQFNHRIGAFAVAILVLLFIKRALMGKSGGGISVGYEYLALLMLVLQVGLGIATLMLQVPVILGILHQAGALLLFICFVHLTRERTRGSH